MPPPKKRRAAGLAAPAAPFPAPTPRPSGFYKGRLALRQSLYRRFTGSRGDRPVLCHSNVKN